MTMIKLPTLDWMYDKAKAVCGDDAKAMFKAALLLGSTVVEAKRLNPGPDTTCSAYIFSNLCALYKQNPDEVCSDRDTPETEVMGRMWDIAAMTSNAIDLLVDFDNWDVMFAYDELDTHAHGSIVSRVYRNCIAGNVPVMEVVKAHAIENGWPLLP